MAGDPFPTGYSLWVIRDLRVIHVEYHEASQHSHLQCIYESKQVIIKIRVQEEVAVLELSTAEPESESASTESCVVVEAETDGKRMHLLQKNSMSSVLGTRLVSLSHEPSMIELRIELSESEWRRWVTVRAPRLNARSTSADAAGALR